MNRMRGAGQSFGAIPANFELIESLYNTLIEKLDQHFAQFPYLLGNKPCIGDFGLIAPFLGIWEEIPWPSDYYKQKQYDCFAGWNE